jgi:hypothetical protein
MMRKAEASVQEFPGRMAFEDVDTRRDELAAEVKSLSASAARPLVRMRLPVK